MFYYRFRLSLLSSRVIIEMIGFLNVQQETSQRHHGTEEEQTREGKKKTKNQKIRDTGPRLH